MLNKDLCVQRVIENTWRQKPEEIDVINSFLIFKALLLQPFRHVIYFNKSTVFTMITGVNNINHVYINYRTEAEI